MGTRKEVIPMMRAASVATLLLVLAHPVRAQTDDFYDCAGPGALLCNDGSATIVESCEAEFYSFSGRVGWEAIRNTGPVSIAIQTRYIANSLHRYIMPVYVEVRGRTPADGTNCSTNLGGHLVLTATGGTRCGGTWETIGPLDLRDYGVPLGDYYNVQLVFFDGIPDPRFGIQFHSVGFSCLRVTSYSTGVASMSWGGVKTLFR